MIMSPFNFIYFRMLFLGKDYNICITENVSKIMTGIA